MEVKKSLLYILNMDIPENVIGHLPYYEREIYLKSYRNFSAMGDVIPEQRVSSHAMGTVVHYWAGKLKIKLFS